MGQAVQKKVERKMKSESLSGLLKDGMAVIEKDFAHIFGVEEVAEQLGVTKNHLIRVFKKNCGKTPGKLLNEVRIENSLDLLSTTSYNLELVANIVGFANANYFCKVFRQVKGMSPNDYRKNTDKRQATETKVNDLIYL